MIEPGLFIDSLQRRGVDLFAGVPDSLLKGLCSYMSATLPSEQYITAASEGGAMGLAAGHYLATGRPAMVFMQNSGLGNTVNPLLSLLDPKVYSIPALLVIGLRGDPDTAHKVGGTDEPQHVSQGKLTVPLLETMRIPWAFVPEDPSSLERVLDEAFRYMQDASAPYALMVKKGTFLSTAKAKSADTAVLPTRESAIEALLEALPSDAAIVSTTGMISRELYELREKRCEGHEKDFLTVGSMGHASQIALGVALACPERTVVCLDGDGAFLMHMGSAAITGQRAPKNFIHVLLNNGAHDSVGGQPTVARNISCMDVASACGYSSYGPADSLEMLREAVSESLADKEGARFIEVLVRKGARKDLGRPSAPPALNKHRFMDFLKGEASPSPQKYHIGESAREELISEIIKLSPSKMFVVHGGKSYSSSGAEKLLLEALDAASKNLPHRIEKVDFSDFHPNPDVSEIEKAYALFEAEGCDSVICLGGGSCMDTAKMTRHLVLERKGVRVPLLAVPTTSGTGAEATRFAVFYDNHKKISVDFPDVLPDTAFVIPSLTYSQGEYLTLCSGFDAFAQACESFWNVHATEESVEYATKAIKDLWPVLLRIADSKDKGEEFSMSEQERFRMGRGSYWAGRAINVTRTTAPHAFAYFLTTNYGYPHGHAVAMTFPFFHSLNVLCPKEKYLGEDYALYKERMFRLSDLLSMEDPSRMQEVVTKLGLGNLRHEENFDYDGFIKAVNPARLSNNPAKVDEEACERLVSYLKSVML